MTLRTRITLIAAAAVALAVLVASFGLYLATSRTLHATVDRSLLEIAAGELPATIDRSFRSGPRVGPYGGAGGTLQVVTSAGATLTPPGGDPPDRLPVTSETVEVAAGRRPGFFTTVRIDGEPVRILTVHAGDGLAVQLARPLTEVEAVLSSLRRQLVLAGLIGIALAAGLGAIVGRRAVRPVADLTRLAEDIAATQDLSRRLEVDDPRDEIGRLSRAFDAMLARLEQARSSQQQLVADASHELRTPLTSLRTNVEVLAELERLDPEDRRRLVDDVVVQIDEFSALVRDLVELARGETPLLAATAVRLDELVDEAARRLDPTGDRIHLHLDATTVSGDADRLQRAVANLLENAVKYGGGTPVEVTVHDGVVRVRDHGPGIDPDDLPHVVERFYRSPAARGEPGSGLGLAIVHQVVAAHRGSLEIGNAPDRGTVATMRFAEIDDAPAP